MNYENPRKPLEKPEVKVGDIWEVDGLQYRIVGPCKNGYWPLSGPLPTRGMHEGTTEDLHNGSLVSRQDHST